MQDLLSGDRVVYQVMADLAMRWSTGLFGTNGYSEIGIAVGATNRPVLETLRRKYDRLFFLVPGYGAQGAGAKDAQFAFDRMGHGAAIMAGRSILYAFRKQDGDGQDYQQAALQAAEKSEKTVKAEKYLRRRRKFLLKRNPKPSLIPKKMSEQDWLRRPRQMPESIKRM